MSSKHGTVFARMFEATSDALKVTADFGQDRLNDMATSVGETPAEYVGAIDGVKEDQIVRKAAALIATSGGAKHNAALVGKAEKPAAPTATAVQQTDVEKIIDRTTRDVISGGKDNDYVRAFPSGERMVMRLNTRTHQMEQHQQWLDNRSNLQARHKQ
ncbi:hypothetical protein A4A49_40364 [Nicotiana attenuata]|uniref:Uncharacterized protein n=1 Tax=Nicotiana attenuata TaxID=49451 RepID=A0A1J6JR49_NICAT|nr:hypothetical protein A4A49_40364 [Nicotiana attenuata]